MNDFSGIIHTVCPFVSMSQERIPSNLLFKLVGEQKDEKVDLKFFFSFLHQPLSEASKKGERFVFFVLF